MSVTTTTNYNRAFALMMSQHSNSHFGAQSRLCKKLPWQKACKHSIESHKIGTVHNISTTISLGVALHIFIDIQIGKYLKPQINNY